MVLDLRGISSFTDYFVICSGTSEPHLKAINSGIREGIREHSHLSPIASEGSVASQWLVMDYSDVLVHIFLQKKREFYALGKFVERCTASQFGFLTFSAMFKQREAIIRLLKDDDPETVHLTKQQLVEGGTGIIPDLRDLLSTDDKQVAVHVQRDPLGN